MLARAMRTQPQAQGRARAMRFAIRLQRPVELHVLQHRHLCAQRGGEQKEENIQIYAKCFRIPFVLLPALASERVLLQVLASERVLL